MVLPTEWSGLCPGFWEVISILGGNVIPDKIVSAWGGAGHTWPWGLPMPERQSTWFRVGIWVTGDLGYWGTGGQETEISHVSNLSIPGSGRFPGEGNDNPLQYSCLENPTDRGAWCPWGCKESDTTEWVHFTSLWCFLLIGVEGGYFKSPFTLRSILFWSICKSK